MAVIAAIAYFSREREPFYNGKPLSRWIHLNATSPRSSHAEQAEVVAIRQIGTNALPFLLKWMRYDSSRGGVRNTLRTILGKLPNSIVPDALQEWIDTSVEEDRSVNAAVAFEPLAELATNAVPELVDMIKDPVFPRASQRAIAALGGIGRPALPILLARLTNTNALHRVEVANLFSIFKELGTNDASVVPILVRCLEDPDSDLRFAAALALGSRAVDERAQAPLVVPALANYLNFAADEESQDMAMRALGAYGDQARASVPVLLRMTEYPVETIRKAATNTLLVIAPEALTNAPPQ